MGITSENGAISLDFTSNIKMKKYRKLHICILYWDLGLGGVQKKIADVISHLHDMYGTKVKITILLNQKNKLDRKDELFLDSTKGKGIRVFYDPGWQWKRFMFPYTLYALGFVYSKKPDVLLTFLHKHGVVAGITKLSLFWRKTKCVHGQDIVLSESLKEMFADSEKLQRKWKRLAKFFYPFLNVIISPSNAVKRDLVRNYNIRENKIKVINNWIKVPSKPGNQKAVYDLIYLGRISSQKRPLMLIDVVDSLLRDDNKEVKICIIGHGELVPELLRYAKEKEVSKYVSFLGTKRNIVNYLYKSKVFILSSQYEGEPIAVLEAMACGLPVVVMDYKGAAGFIKDGVNGYVCQDSKEFVSRIKYLLENSEARRRMGARARDFVKTKRSHTNLESFVSYLVPSQLGLK